MRIGFLLLFIAVLAGAQTAEEVMAKVAENQSRAQSARAGFVYRQDVLVRLKRSNGKLARQEEREYSVTPEPNGVKREMVHFSGKYGIGGKEIPINEPGQKYKDLDIDADIAKSLADDFGEDEKSRDGINDDLFPLTAERQKNSVFILAGQETYHGREVYRITFEPRSRAASGDDAEKGDDTPWAGEALIDKTDLTPVLVTTHLARGIPLPVKILLGTDIRQLGFKVTYEKFGDNLWFPVSYSGEMKLRALFLYTRTISVGLVNSGFQKAAVNSTITFEKSRM